MSDAFAVSDALARGAQLLGRLQDFALDQLTGAGRPLTPDETGMLERIMAPTRRASSDEQVAVHRLAGFQTAATGQLASAGGLAVAFLLADDPSDAKGLISPLRLLRLAGHAVRDTPLQAHRAMRFQAWLKSIWLMDGSVLPKPIRSEWALWTMVHLSVDGGAVPQLPIGDSLRALADKLAGTSQTGVEFFEMLQCCEVARAVGRGKKFDPGHPILRCRLARAARYGFSADAKGSLPEIPIALRGLLKTMEKAD